MRRVARCESDIGLRRNDVAAGLTRRRSRPARYAGEEARHFHPEDLQGSGDDEARGRETAPRIGRGEAQTKRRTEDEQQRGTAKTLPARIAPQSTKECGSSTATAVAMDVSRGPDTSRLVAMAMTRLLA